MSEPAPAAARLAVRRPGWQLPEIHAGLQLASLEPLWGTKERLKCPKCGRSRAHYCYDCLQPLLPCPHVDLPFRVSIVTHHEEKASKNTGVQVAILAAGQVDLHNMKNVPLDVDPSRCAVLFPCDTALDIAQLEPNSIDRLFIIDSRWKKAGELVRSDVFRSMRAVRLSETRSAFWRFHTKGVTDEGVCTVEALFFCLNALAKEGKLSDPRFTAPHAFDNLLWYFVYQHQVVAAAAQKRLEATAAAQGPEGDEQAQPGQSGLQGQRFQQQGKEKQQQKQKQNPPGQGRKQRGKKEQQQGEQQQEQEQQGGEKEEQEPSGAEVDDGAAPAVPNEAEAEAVQGTVAAGDDAEAADVPGREEDCQPTKRARV